MVELVRELKREERDIEHCPVSAENLAALLDLVQEGVISGKMAKTVFEEMFETGRSPRTIVQEKGLIQMTMVFIHLLDGIRDQMGRIPQQKMGLVGNTFQ